MIQPRNLSLNEWKKKFLDEGYYEPWAEVKAKHEYESRLINIPFTMPEMVPVGTDMGPLD